MSSSVVFVASSSSSSSSPWRIPTTATPHCCASSCFWAASRARRCNGRLRLLGEVARQPRVKQGLQIFVSATEDTTAVADDGIVTEAEMQSTLRLVESAMLAATAGLAYFLSNLLKLESYFACFFPLPVVISSMKWGAACGRKTMVTTALLLSVIAGPLKAASYVLMHGLPGLAIGALWRWNFGWGISIILSTLVRACGAIGFVLLSSWLFRENILNLITINTHASLSLMASSMGINVAFSMFMIYVFFTFLLLVNCASFVFILHVLYVIFLHKLGITTGKSVPNWVKGAL